MANGVSYPDIQRPNYFTSQLLVVSDFEAEQAYHRDMRLLHNRSLHTWGIVQGLDVQKAADNKSITVSRGMAIDNQGNEIVLAKDATPNDWPQLRFNQTNKDVYVTIRYNHVPDQNTKRDDILGVADAYSREKEIPTIEIAETSPASDGSVIVLAKLTLNDQGVITNVVKTLPTRSQSAGSIIDPAADLRLRSLLVEDKVGIGAPSPGAKLEVANHALDDTAFQPLIRLLAHQKDESSSNVFDESKPSYGIEFYRRWSSTTNIQAGIYAWATGNLGSGLAFRTKPSSGSGATLPTRMVITDGGNVGIGTTAPKSTLSVKGGLAVGASYAGTNAAPANGLLVEGNVGIGTTSPGAKLSFANLYDGRDTADGITWKNDNPTEYGIHRTAGAWTSPNYQQLRLAWDTGIVLYPGTAHGKSYVDVQGRGLRVTAGNVGIGTNDPKAKLEVAVAVDDDTKPLVVGKGTTNYLTMLNNGNVGIGTTDPGTNRLKVNGTLNVTGTSTLTGSVTIPDPSSLSFGGTTRQMINLCATTHGIGIQSSTQYFRTDKNFAWYKGGSHDNGELNAGGGTMQMVIKDGNVGIGTIDPGAARLKVDGTLNVTGTSTLTGAVTIPSPSSLSFGGTTRQMINLAGTTYGIGIQGSTQYFRTDKNFAWYKGGSHDNGELNAGGGTVQMVIKDGNVGIGATAPGAKLEVAVAAADTDTKPLVVGKGTTNYLTMLNNGNVGIGATDPTTDLQFRNLVKDSKVEIGRRAAERHAAGNVPSELSLGLHDGGFAGVRIVNERKMPSNDANNQYICFDTHLAQEHQGERMRIAPNGFVGIGTTAPEAPLHIKAVTPQKKKYGATSEQQWGLYVEGHAVALKWHTYSDARIKVNPTPVDPVCSLKTLMNLTLCEYEYIPEFQLSSSGHKYHGFLAQEVERVIPEAVTTAGDKRLVEGRLIEGLRVVAHDRIFSEAVGAIQALHAMLQQQNARILALEGQNSAG